MCHVHGLLLDPRVTIPLSLAEDAVLASVQDVKVFLMSD
jgi:hypothetical protein